MAQTIGESVRVVGKPCAVCGSTERYACGNCVACAIARSKLWKRRNKAKVAAYSKAYHAKYPEAVLARHRKNRKLPEPTRPEPSGCEMCGAATKQNSLNLDHDHVTGEFRGWLCWGCNVALGKLGDSVSEALARIERYASVIGEAHVSD